MTTRRAIVTNETLFERIRDEFEEDPLCPSEEEFHEMLSDLCDEGVYLECHPLDEDGVGYMARFGLKWTDFQDLSCPIKKQILLYLVDNPKTFFVLLNTQKGKTAIIKNHLSEWILLNQQDSKIVPFIFMMNDRTLADQTQESFNDRKTHIPKHLNIPEHSNIFQLSSNSKTTETEILPHIDAWASDMYGDYKTPVILTLPNNRQIQKVVFLLEQIKKRALRGSPLRYALVIDEYDQVYPLIRDKLLPYIECDQALHKLGFISATDGDTLDEYPECANAHFESHGEDSPDYRAFHHEDSVIQIISRAPKKHNAFAYKVIDENTAHFTTPVILKNGRPYYRKIIVNGDSSRASMEDFARKMTDGGMNYCITINMFGIKLFVDGGVKHKKSIRGRSLNMVLYWVYRKFALDNKPLYIIGNRKVDRGLGFHFAPRRNIETGEFDTKLIEFDGEKIVSEGGDGLIFTDEILGRIDRRETASQKAGRCAGIIAQSPNYCVQVHYWTDAKTAGLIKKHNKKVDYMNELSGTYTAGQADVRAREREAQDINTHPRGNTNKSLQTFASTKDAQEWFSGLNLKRTLRRRDKNDKSKSGLVEEVEYKSSPYGEKTWYRMNEHNEWVLAPLSDATHLKVREEHTPIPTVDEFNRSDEWLQGATDRARIVPVRVGTEIQFMVIYKKT